MALRKRVAWSTTEKQEEKKKRQEKKAFNLAIARRKAVFNHLGHYVRINSFEREKKKPRGIFGVSRDEGFRVRKNGLRLIKEEA